MHALESHSIKSCSLLRIGRLERENEELKEVLKTIENELRQAQINCPAVCLRRELKETRRSMDTEVRRLEKQVRTLFTARVLHAVLILLPQLEKCKSEVKIESDIRAAAERETVRIKQGTCLSLTHPFTCSLTHSLTYSHTHSLTHSLTLTHSLPPSLPPSLTHSLTHSLTPSLTHSLTHSLTPSLTHSLPHSLTHSLTHTLTHSLNSPNRS